MNWVYKHICAPLMLVNNNVYTFLSGILVSCSINLFSSLCVERCGFVARWHLYASSFCLLVAGAVCMCLGVKISAFQKFIYKYQIKEDSEQKAIVCDVTSKKKISWSLAFITLISSSVSSIVFLLMNFIVN